MNGYLVSFFNVGCKGKDMLIDKIFKLLLNKFNLKLLSLPIKLYIQSPTDILISFISMKFGISKIIITLIIAFLL